MNTIFKLITVTVFFLLCLTFCPNSFASINEKKITELDKKIVKAFNAEPKKTDEIYGYCTEMIELCSSSNVENSQEWISKCRRVITLACANEASKEIDNGNYKKAYEWVNKGIERGAADGSEAGFDIGKLYKYLLDIKQKLEQHFNQYNIPYQKTNYSYSTSTNKQLNNKLFNKQ